MRTAAEILTGIQEKTARMADLSVQLKRSQALETMWPDCFSGSVYPNVTSRFDARKWRFIAIDTHGVVHEVPLLVVDRVLWSDEAVAAYNAASKWKKQMLLRVAQRESAADGKTHAGNEVSGLVAHAQDRR
jgi:hypothetical protein